MIKQRYKNCKSSTIPFPQYSGDLNTKHLNSEPIQNPNFFMFRFGMDQYYNDRDYCYSNTLVLTIWKRNQYIGIQDGGYLVRFGMVSQAVWFGNSIGNRNHSKSEQLSTIRKYERVWYSSPHFSPGPLIPRHIWKLGTMSYSHFLGPSFQFSLCLILQTSLMYNRATIQWPFKNWTFKFWAPVLLKLLQVV